MGLRASDFPNQSLLTPEELERQRLEDQRRMAEIDSLGGRISDMDVINRTVADTQLEMQPDEVMTDQEVIDKSVADTLAAPELPAGAETQQTEPIKKPNTTAALETELASKPAKVEEKPEPAFKTEAPDEASQLMDEYRKTKKDIADEEYDLERSRAESATSRQNRTAIAGALQAFGEGLAAITGGSAKPIQTGAATLQKVGEQEAAEEERKAKTLKERLQSAKAPLEEKTTEMELRSRLGKAKTEQDLLDPASEKSAQARANATSFIDNMIAQGQANQADPGVLQRLEQSKMMLENMSAAQVQDFYNSLKPLSTDTSLEAKNRFDMQKIAAQEGLRSRLADAKNEKDQEKLALKDFMKIRTKIAEEENTAAKIGPQMEKFKADINLALQGDKAAARRVTQNYGVVNYLNARSYESKGVFTDNDLKALSQLDAGKTWFQQMDDFVTRGMTGTLPREALIRVKGVLDSNIDKFTNPGQYIRENYAQTFEDAGVPAYQRYADKLREGIKKTPKTEPEAVAQPTEKIKVGDVVDGYQFTGGDVNDPANWKQVK